MVRLYKKLSQYDITMETSLCHDENNDDLVCFKFRGFGYESDICFIPLDKIENDPIESEATVYVYLLQFLSTYIIPL